MKGWCFNERKRFPTFTSSKFYMSLSQVTPLHHALCQVAQGSTGTYLPYWLKKGTAKLKCHTQKTT